VSPPQRSVVPTRAQVIESLSSSLPAAPSPPTVHPALRAFWSGFTLLLNKVEGCVDGTLAKAPIHAINSIIEMVTVRLHIIRELLTFPSHISLQAVIDNQDDLTEQAIQMVERMSVVSNAMGESTAQDSQQSLQHYWE
jgi:hypothetical protein